MIIFLGFVACIAAGVALTALVMTGIVLLITDIISD